MTDELHAARVYIEQARAFRLRGDAFAITLLEWAGKARRRHMDKRAPPVQSDMFDRPSADPCRNGRIGP